MRRDTLRDAAFGLVLLLAAAAVAVPFRAEALRRLADASVTWDAACHALSGLDLYDDLRLLRPLDALGDVLSQHWWGPLYGIVLVPAYALGGVSRASASLPSAVAFVLTAPAVFLAARAVLGSPDAFESTALAALAGAFALRSPLLLEASAWPMLESLGGLLGVSSLALFAIRGDARARRLSCALAAAAFFLKVHYGVFLLATLGAAVLVETPKEARREMRAALSRVVPRRAGAAVGLALGALVAGRLALEAAGGDRLARLLPSVPNVLWGTLVLAVLAAAGWRRAWAPAWQIAPETVRDLVLFGILPPAVWCLDPANVRGWYRQVFQATDAPIRDPLAQIASYAGFLRDDYTMGFVPLVLVVAGLVLALVLPGSGTRRTLAAFALWPIVLMGLNPYPAEARFAACLVPALFAAAAAGLVAGAARLPRAAGRAVLAGLLLALGAALVSREGAWRREKDARATYRYPYDAEGERAVAAALASAPAAGPVRLGLPATPAVWPTVRLGVRLVRRDLPPAEVVVEARGPAGPPLGR